MAIYALTGGVASGKSTVSKHFQALGATQICADRITHELLTKGSPCFQTIIDAFGHDVLDESNSQINRPALKNIIFKSPKKRQQLEAIIHPEVRREIQKKVNQLRDRAIIIIEIPLLKSKADFPYLDGIIFIDCRRETQLARLLRRDGISETLAVQMLKSQTFLQETKKETDFIIYNDEDRETLQKKVEVLFSRLLI